MEIVYDKKEVSYEYLLRIMEKNRILNMIHSFNAFLIHGNDPSGMLNINRSIRLNRGFANIFMSMLFITIKESTMQDKRVFAPDLNDLILNMKHCSSFRVHYYINKWTRKIEKELGFLLCFADKEPKVYAAKEKSSREVAWRLNLMRIIVKRKKRISWETYRLIMQYFNMELEDMPDNIRSKHMKVLSDMETKIPNHKDLFVNK